MLNQKNCDYNCTGNSTSNCGGLEAFNLYYIGSSHNISLNHTTASPISSNSSLNSTLSPITDFTRSSKDQMSTLYNSLNTSSINHSSNIPITTGKTISSNLSLATEAGSLLNNSTNASTATNAFSDFTNFTSLFFNDYLYSLSTPDTTFNSTQNNASNSTESIQNIKNFSFDNMTASNNVTTEATIILNQSSTLAIPKASLNLAQTFSYTTSSLFYSLTANLAASTFLTNTTDNISTTLLTNKNQTNSNSLVSFLSPQTTLVPPLLSLSSSLITTSTQSTSLLTMQASTSNGVLTTSNILYSNDNSSFLITGETLYI